MLVSWRLHQNQVEEKKLKIVSFEGGFTPPHPGCNCHHQDSEHVQEWEISSKTAKPSFATIISMGIIKIS